MGSNLSFLFDQAGGQFQHLHLAAVPQACRGSTERLRIFGWQKDQFSSLVTSAVSVHSSILESKQSYHQSVSTSPSGLQIPCFIQPLAVILHYLGANHFRCLSTRLVLTREDLGMFRAREGRQIRTSHLGLQAGEPLLNWRDRSVEILPEAPGVGVGGILHYPSTLLCNKEHNPQLSWLHDFLYKPQAESDDALVGLGSMEQKIGTTGLAQGAQVLAAKPKRHGRRREETPISCP